MADLRAGFLVFLIALPLCLGISLASGVPPTSGLITAIVGGLLGPAVGSARLTIKGPAAGLIAIALGAVTELGAGDPVAGYHRALAVGVVAGMVQVVFALTRTGVIGDLMPSAVVQGMLAAIGVIIVSKQAHVALGVVPVGVDPLSLLAEIPDSMLHLQPAVFAIGLAALGMLYGMPLVRGRWVRAVPAQLMVLLVAVPMAAVFGLGPEQMYQFAQVTDVVAPVWLSWLPASMAGVLAFPDFSQVFSPTSLKYIVMFALVGSIESLLSVTAVDTLDPQRRSSDLNRDLLATGLSNVVAASMGGLPMISEIVRSKANIDSGARSHWSNFAHGAFLLLSLALIPGLLHWIPLAALAAMLIYTGTRLASPAEFMRAYHLGSEQVLVFVTTMLVTLMTDLLVGVAAGLALKAVLDLASGAPLARLFSAVVSEERRGDQLRLTVHDAALFSNYLGLKRRLDAIPADIRTVVIDFDNAWVVDHTVLSRLDALSGTWNDRTLELVGLDDHRAVSHHPLASRRKVRDDAGE